MASQEVIVTVKLDTATKAFLTDLSKRHAEQVAPRPARLATGGAVVPIQLQATTGQKLEQVQIELTRLAEEIDAKGVSGLRGPLTLADRLRRLAQVQ